MASHWPVIVGINQYQSLQPLMYAQFDALELRDFLVNEVGLLPQFCSLLTDVSPMVYQGSAAPTQTVLLERLAQSCDRAGPEDTVWFFFSGYGVHWQGQDYLLPIDADPNRIEQTGILIETLLKRMGQGNQHQSIVMLDINRPQSALSPSTGGRGLGAQTLELAEELAIPLILSCQSHQFSQETLAVRHGLFTEALIEGMRFHGCLTLAQMVDYLRDRVPELCQHHWRPAQNPTAEIPPGQQHAMLVPSSLVGQMPVGIPPESELLPVLPEPELVLPPLVEPLVVGGPSQIVPTAPTDSAGSQSWPSVEPPAPERPPVVEPPTAADSIPEPKPSASANWPVPWRWGLLGAGLLLLGVLWRNQASLWVGQPTPESTTPPVPIAEEPASGPLPPDSPGAEPLFPGTAMSGAEALERGRNALAQQQFGEALSWFEQIPEVERPVDYQALVDQAEVGYTRAELSGDVALDRARRLIEPVS
ncbi:MAG: caspase family protein, partial [Cyanobacteria bacterium J06638_6]